uniref:uncharacterized protein isoform X2 n=1 Tax=Pristiophorus japonicus TaxID=55135 RepID=UPI00398EFBEF
MEKCAELNERRRALLRYRGTRGNPAVPDKKDQLHSSVNCVRALELIKPTVFKVTIKNKYEISATDRHPPVIYSYKPSLDSSQLNLGKVTAWGNTTSIPASLKNQTTQSRPTAETRRYPFRSTTPKVKTPDENRMLCIAAYGTKCDLQKRRNLGVSSYCSPTFIKNESPIRAINIESLDNGLEKLIHQFLDEQNLTREDNTCIITNHDAEDHLSRKEELLVEASCETASSSGSLDSEFQQTEVNVRETLHLYLPTHDIQEEEEFTNACEPPEDDVSKNSEVSNGNLKRREKYKNTKKKQDDKKDSRIKVSTWASRPGSGFKDQMQRRPTCTRKSVPAATITGVFIEQKKEETFADHPSSLNQTQPLEHNYINRPVVDLTICDLEAEPDDAHRPQENAHINNSQSNTNENPTLVTDTENDKEKTKTFGFSTYKLKYWVVNINNKANLLGRPQNIQQKQCISRIQMARYKPPHAKQ